MLNMLTLASFLELVNLTLQGFYYCVVLKDSLNDILLVSVNDRTQIQSSIVSLVGSFASLCHSPWTSPICGLLLIAIDL